MNLDSSTKEKSTEQIINTENRKLFEKKRLLLQAFIILSACFSNLSDGMSTGWISTAIAQMMTPNSTNEIKITSDESAWIGTLPMYAIFCSAPFSIYSANRLGRKWTILWGSALTCVSWICLAVARNVELLYVAAFIRGFGGNVIFTVIPMYSAEITQASIRGLVGSFVAVMMNVGVLLSYVTTMCFPLHVTSILGAVAAALVIPLFVWAPRSPYHILVSSGNRTKALESFKLLRGNNPYVDEEFAEIELYAEKEKLERQNATPILELVTIKSNRKVTFLVITLQFIQQLTGVDAILIYLEFILDVKSYSIIFGAAKLLSCIISLVLIDKVGRKPLLLFSCIISCMTLFILGIYFYLKEVLLLENSSLSSWLPLTLLVIFICGYNIGLGIVPFIYGGETYPIKIKALGVTLGETMYALPMIIATQIFSLTREKYGVYFSFLIYSAFSLLGTIFCKVFIIETKGRTLEEIQDELKKES